MQIEEVLLIRFPMSQANFIKTDQAFTSKSMLRLVLMIIRFGLTSFERFSLGLKDRP